ncbi:MAG: hypothetical protein A2W23_09105 [Planctomycetes bacterium RBG_16_43_13]|nr:MAG: hypothetical protein A2W23_09105 [Planctomycetes bacterium RBG_16_43_13]
MTSEQLRRVILLYLFYLCFVSAVLWLFLAEVSSHLPFVTPDNIFHLLMEAQLFFVLIIWPLVIPAVLQNTVYNIKGEGQRPSLNAISGRVSVLFLQVLMFFILTLPISLMCTSIANLDWIILAKGSVYVFAIALIVAAVFDIGITRKLNIAPIYYLIIFILSAGVPFLYYLMREFYGRDAIELSVLSPFWCALYIGEGNGTGWLWLMQVAMFAVVLAIIYAVVYLFGRGRKPKISNI